MILIICWHFGCHCIKIVDFDFTLIGCFHWIVRSFANNAVNTYLLISAYFLCKSSFKANKLSSLILEVWFYSVVIYALLLFTGNIAFSVKDAFTTLLPILSGKYWFASSYALLYILSPFLNKCIDALNKKQHLTLVGVLLVSFCVIPNFLFFVPWVNWGTSCGIVWMVVLYYVGSYLRKYINIDSLKEHRTKLLWITLTLCMLPFISKVVIAYLSRALTGSVVGSSLFYMNNSVMIVASSISVFLLFITIDIKSERTNSIIRFVAPSTFAVYLIHDNPQFFEKMWSFVYQHMHLTDYRCIGEFFIAVIAIFCSCILFDLIRRLIFWSLSKTTIVQSTAEKLKSIKLI